MSQDDVPDLIDLVRLRFVASGLEVENLLDTVHTENVVISLYSFREAEFQQ